jgi:hypothetical protein
MAIRGMHAGTPRPGIDDPPTDPEAKVVVDLFLHPAETVFRGKDLDRHQRWLGEDLFVWSRSAMSLL